MQAPPKRTRHLNLRQQDTLVAWLLLIPGLIIILGITLQPVLSTLYLSFFDVSSGIKAHQTFVGFGNYLNLLSEATFWQTIGRTFYFTFVSVAAELVLGIAIAQ